MDAPPPPTTTPDEDPTKCPPNPQEIDNTQTPKIDPLQTAVGELEPSGVGNNVNVTLSKTALKKLAKKRKFEENKLARRQREKEAKKLKKKLGVYKPPPKVSCKKMSESNSQVGIIIDLSLDHLMNEKDLGKCIKQIGRSYSVNRRAENPLQFHLTSVNGPSKAILERYDGYTNWDVNIHAEHYEDIFKKESLVYLTSESDNIIEDFEDGKFYIIGGLVDHNSQKGLCLKVAEEKGIAHGQLPIGEYIKMESRKVLTINHVFEIACLRVNGKSWNEALIEVIPPRKNPLPKGAGEVEEVKTHEGSNASNQA